MGKKSVFRRNFLYAEGIKGLETFLMLILFDKKLVPQKYITLAFHDVRKLLLAGKIGKAY